MTGIHLGRIHGTRNNKQRSLGQDGYNGNPGGGEPLVKNETHEHGRINTEIMKMGTINIRGYAGKENQLDEELNRRGIRIAVISETKKKGCGTDSTKNYVTIYSGVPKSTRAAGGVMIYVHKAYKDEIQEYNIHHERIITVKIREGRSYLNIIGVYTPEEGRNEASDDFYEALQKAIQRINPEEGIIVAGDLNEKVGLQKVGKTVGTFGIDETNGNGKRLIETCAFNGLKIMNTFYKHKLTHKITWSARGLYSMIDYIIANEGAARECLDVRTYRGLDLDSDHYLVQGVFRINKSKRKRKEEIKKKLNIKALDDDTSRWLYQRRLNMAAENKNTSEDIEEEWRNIKDIVKQAAHESLGTRRAKIPDKKLRNWNEEIQTLVREKQAAFRRWMNTKKMEDKVEYNRKAALAKRKSRELQRNSWDDFVANLEQEVYKVRPRAYKILRRIRSDFNERVNLPKLQMKDAEKYFSELWNNTSNNAWEEAAESIEGDSEEINKQELEEALRRTKNSKAPGEDEIPSELYKYASASFKKRLLKFMNLIMRKEQIPEEYRNAIVIPIFKKGDMLKAENYRGISLLNTCYKILVKIWAKRISEAIETKLLESQNGFRRGRSCTDASYTVKLLMEKRIEHNEETHLCFIDLEKAYDNVDRHKLFKILPKYNISPKMIRIIQKVYENTKIVIKLGEQKSDHVQINRGVRQGCPLSCVLFNIYMDAITREWITNKPRGVNLTNGKHIETVLFADDQVIVAENEDDLQRSAYSLGKVMAKYGMKISLKKTKTIAFKGKEPVRSKIVVYNGIVEQVNTFRYLGMDILYKGEVDIENKLYKFIKLTGLLNRTMPVNKVRKETRVRVYNTLAVPTLTYGCENWAMKKSDKKRFMRRTAGVTLSDRIKSEVITDSLGVTPIIRRIKNYRKKWRSHVERMEEGRSPKMITEYTPTAKRSRGRPRKKLVDTSSSDSASNTPTGQ